MSRTITAPTTTTTTTVTLAEERTEIVLSEHDVTWAEGAVDNEFAGRKSSKKCCIFHKAHDFCDSSSSESDSDASDYDDEETRKKKSLDKWKKVSRGECGPSTGPDKLNAIEREPRRDKIIQERKKKKVEHDHNTK